MKTLLENGTEVRAYLMQRLRVVLHRSPPTEVGQTSQSVQDIKTAGENGLLASFVPNLRYSLTQGSHSELLLSTLEKMCKYRERAGGGSG